MTSVLIVEDVDTMRALLTEVVKAVPGVQVSGVARNVWEARLELSRRKPDLVLLDEILPGESSHELLAEATELGVVVLLITGLEDAQHPLIPGAAGRLMKPAWGSIPEDTQRFEAAIRAIFPLFSSQ
jgi:two-component system response regulator CitB